jgi:hypothetical protein
LEPVTAVWLCIECHPGCQPWSGTDRAAAWAEGQPALHRRQHYCREPPAPTTAATAAPTKRCVPGQGQQHMRWQVLGAATPVTAVGPARRSQACCLLAAGRQRSLRCPCSVMCAECCCGTLASAHALQRGEQRVADWICAAAGPCSVNGQLPPLSPL